MASRKIEDLDPVLQKAWIDSFNEWEDTYPTLPKPFLTCTFRDNEEQEILYMQNKNGKDDDGDGKIDESDEWRSNAKPGQSKHNQFPSKALDVAFKNTQGKLDWSEVLFAKLAKIMKTRGVQWGGDWKRKDTPHFEI
jgi:hypothetical protein